MNITAAFEYDATHQVQVAARPNSTHQPAKPYTILQLMLLPSNCGQQIIGVVDLQEARHCTPLKGGYDSGYSSIVGEAKLIGKLTIRSGKVIANGLSIR